MAPHTLTFNQKAREIQGFRALGQRPEALDRIANNWTPECEAAKREHQELDERRKDTPALQFEYRDQQVALVDKQGNKQLREIMRMSLVDTTNAYDRWLRQASEVEGRTAKALSKIQDMNTFILLYKNRSDVGSFTKYDDLHLHITGAFPCRSDRSWKAWKAWPLSRPKPPAWSRPRSRSESSRWQGTTRAR